MLGWLKSSFIYLTEYLNEFFDQAFIKNGKYIFQMWLEKDSKCLPEALHTLWREGDWVVNHRPVGPCRDEGTQMARDCATWERPAYKCGPSLLPENMVGRQNPTLRHETPWIIRVAHCAETICRHNLVFFWGSGTLCVLGKKFLSDQASVNTWDFESPTCVPGR